MLSYTGSWIPFPLTKQERLKSGDPRPSIEERYRDRQAYLDKIDYAARELVQSGFALESDLPLLHDRAAREWDFIHSAAPQSD